MGVGKNEALIKHIQEAVSDKNWKMLVARHRVKKTKRIKLSDVVFSIVKLAQDENIDRDFPRTRASLQATKEIVRLIQNNYRRRKK